MDSITRRNFLGKAGALSAWGMLAGSAPLLGAEGFPMQGGSVENAAFRLALDPGVGLRNTQIIHLPSGLALADGDYSYSFCRPEFRESLTLDSPAGTRHIACSGAAMEGQLAVLHEFRLSRDQPWME